PSQAVNEANLVECHPIECDNCEEKPLAPAQTQLRPSPPRREQRPKKDGSTRQAQLRQPHSPKTAHSLFCSHDIGRPKHRSPEEEKMHQGVAVAMGLCGSELSFFGQRATQTLPFLQSLFRFGRGWAHIPARAPGGREWFLARSRSPLGR